MTLRIANGAGFLGDDILAPRSLVESAEIDYLTLEYLAELTMSILARAREKNRKAGYAADFVEVTRSLIPALAGRRQLKLITNAGGVNPVGCAASASEVLCSAGLDSELIAAVRGDDLMQRLDELKAGGCLFENLDSGQPLSELSRTVVCANAYLGARQIVEALAGGARVVITGRVADASLTVGPAINEFQWMWDDWKRLAGASVAGHLIECGAQVTGGYSTDWKNSNLTTVGYPIAELDEAGNAIITKPNGTGGVVNRGTVVEQLVYEIGDPSHYLTPDVDVDFTTVEVEAIGTDRVRVFNASGQAPPDAYKVSLAYHDGFMATGQLLVYGMDCVEKAQGCAKMILERVRAAGFDLEQSHIELLGSGAGVPIGDVAATNELVLRLTVKDARREAVELFARQFAPLITSGPAGLAGYASGRISVRPVFAFWPTSIPKDLVTPTVEIRTAQQWSDRGA